MRLQGILLQTNVRKLSPTNMKLSEIIVIDLAEKAYLNMHTLLENLNLLENNNNSKIFDEFVADEKTSCARNLNSSSLYFPLYLQSAPVGEIILGRYLLNPSSFIRNHNGRYEFKNKNGIFRFPLDKSQGDGRIDLFIFEHSNDQQHFLSILNLKFAGWNINVTQADI